MHLLGLTGRLHSGKDTVYEILERQASHLGLKTQRVGFADYLKVSAAVALGGLGEDLHDLSPEGRIKLISAANDFKEKGSVMVASQRANGSGFTKTLSGREFLQIYGTEAHRGVFDDEDFWVSVAFPYETILSGSVDILVFTDVRFDNEAWSIRTRASHSRDMHSTIAEVVREPFVEGGHISEAGVSRHFIDHTIDNAGSLEELEDEISVLLVNMIALELDPV